MAYDIQGTFYEACDCEIICSCWASIDPGMAQCTGLWAWELGEGSKIDGLPVDGCKVVILTHGTSCDDAERKLILIDSGTDPDKEKRYQAIHAALIDSSGPWCKVLNAVGNLDQGTVNTTIDIIPANDNLTSDKVSISVKPISSPPINVTFATANCVFVGIEEPSRTTLSSDSRLAKAILGSLAGTGKIEVGYVGSKRGEPTGVLNLLADIEGYTFDLDVSRVSASRGKFSYSL